MRNRAVLLLMLPAVLAAVGVAVAWTRSRELAARARAGRRGRALVWPLTLGGALVGLLVGVVVGVLTGLVGGRADLGRDAMDGTFLLVPGMLAGLGAGLARWATITAVWRRPTRVHRPRLRRPGRR